MNTYIIVAQFKKIFFAIVAVAIFAPAVSFAAIPSAQVSGFSFVEKTSATVLVTFNANGAPIGVFNDKATVFAEFTNIKTNNTEITAYANPSSQTQTYSFRMDKLSPGTEYRVVAIIEYQGMILESLPKTFTTKESYTAQVSQENSSSGTSESTNAFITIPTFWSLFGGTSSPKNTVQKKIMTGGVENKNGVGIAITNEQARVDARDTFTYTVRYQNGRTTSLQGTKIVIDLPQNYEFVRSSADLDYNTKTNSVILVTGRIPAGTSKSFTFTARALDGNSGQVQTKATLFYEGGSVSVIDRDSFYGGSRSALGASVFGLGFFPQTLYGWLGIIIIITLIIIFARRYAQAPIEKPNPEHQQKTA